MTVYLAQGEALTSVHVGQRVVVRKPDGAPFGITLAAGVLSAGQRITVDFRDNCMIVWVHEPESIGMPMFDVSLETEIQRVLAVASGMGPSRWFREKRAARPRSLGTARRCELARPVPKRAVERWHRASPRRFLCFNARRS